MGVSLQWYPKSKKNFSFKCSYSSSDVEKIRDIFGNELSEKDVPKLRNFYEATGREIYNELAELVEEHENIVLKELW